MTKLDTASAAFEATAIEMYDALTVMTTLMKDPSSPTTEPADAAFEATAIEMYDALMIMTTLINDPPSPATRPDATSR